MSSSSGKVVRHRGQVISSKEIEVICDVEAYRDKEVNYMDIYISAVHE